jgi:micrococcal nuclease
MQPVVLAILAAGVLAMALVGLPMLSPSSALAPASIRFVAPFVHNPPGNDWHELNAEIVTLANDSDETVDLSGWSLRNGAKETYEFPRGTTLEPEGRLTVHSGCGSDTETDLYWCSVGPIWDDTSGVATLMSSDGRKVDVHAYDSLCIPCGDTE